MVYASPYDESADLFPQIEVRVHPFIPVRGIVPRRERGCERSGKLVDRRFGKNEARWMDRDS
jgi:hypothetical protein